MTRSSSIVLDLYDGGPGDQWLDHSVHGNNGTLVNGVTRSLLPDDTTEYMNFVAADSEYANCGNDVSLHTTEMTAICWYRTSSVTTVRLMSKLTGAWGGTGWMFYVQGTGAQNRLVFGVCTAGGGDWAHSGDGVDGADGIWHLGVGTWDGANLNCYSDGVLRDSNTPAGIQIQNTAANLLISDSAAEILQGDLYRPRILTRPLSEPKIAKLFQKERGIFGA